MIRRAVSSDLGRIAEMHCRYIPGYLRNIGPKFLEKFYKNFMALPGGVILVSGEGEEISGYIAGYTPADSLFMSLARESRLSLVFSVLFHILLNPGETGELLELARYGGRVKVPGVDGELFFIALEPPARKSGAADQLVEEACKILAEKGAKKIKVSADKENRGPNILLERLGFEPVGEFPFRGRPQNLYVRTAIRNR
ncbi:MAG: GNAT family N-acetyltransferase [Chloroflexi bacterium]|nr:GNAT family N-acetyltransferase [Chloroflexota bacterium]